MRLVVNGVGYSVAQHNAGARPAVVLLHYFGGSSRSWAEVVGALGGDTRCVAPDLRGFGDTEAPADGYTVDDYADDVGALIDALGVGDYVLAGHSMGGKIALALAARRPAGLRSLVLLAPSPPTAEPMGDDERARLLASHGVRTAALETVRKLTHRPLTPALLERAVHDNLRSSRVAWRAWLERGSREDISGRMGDVDVPVAVLVGRNDPVMPRPVQQHEVAGPVGGTLTVASDAGHLLPLESPATVAHALRTALRGAPPPPRYPPGTVRALLDTDLCTAPTRAALAARHATAGDDAPRFFDAVAYATLRAACAGLVPQPERPNPVDLAAAIDRRLAEDVSDGWRYDTMPPDREAYRLGLRGFDESAQAMFDTNFATLAVTARDTVLGAVQRGEAPGESWSTVPASRFFEELLAECVEAYYSAPAAQDEIGYAGFADAHGWQTVGADHLQPHEPRPLGAGAQGAPA